MSEPCRLRRGEGYGACDDEVVNKCALNREKRRRSAPVVRNTPRMLPLYLGQAEKKVPDLVQRHLLDMRQGRFQDCALLNESVIAGFPFFDTISGLRFLQPVLGLDQLLFIICHAKHLCGFRIDLEW